MARRADPKRIDAARRAAVRNVLIDENGMSPDLADTWITSWEAEAAGRGLVRSSEYWTLGLVWIHEQTRRKG